MPKLLPRPQKANANGRSPAANRPVPPGARLHPRAARAQGTEPAREDSESRGGLSHARRSPHLERATPPSQVLPHWGSARMKLTLIAAA